MQFSLLDSVEVAPEELLKPANWTRRKGGRLTAPRPKKKPTPTGSDIRLVRRRYYGGNPRYSWPDKKISRITGGIYRLTLSSQSNQQTNVKDTWFSAGWVGVRVGGSYVESFKFPLNKTLFYIPKYTDMELWFKPVSWLENINYQLEEFRGEWTEKSQSSTQFVLDVLGSEGSPLQDLKDQIDEIPGQVTEAFDSPEWDWRDNLPG